MNVETVKLIWENELSELVRQTYGRPYQLQQQGDMLGQNSLVRVTVPDEPFEMDDDQRFADWLAAIPPAAERPDWKSDQQAAHDHLVDCLRWDRDFYPPLECVLNDLHARGLLEAGKYVIHVWW